MAVHANTKAPVALTSDPPENESTLARTTPKCRSTQPKSRAPTPMQARMRTSVCTQLGGEGREDQQAKHSSVIGRVLKNMNPGWASVLECPPDGPVWIGV
jgi:hypothetical protein